MPGPRAPAPGSGPGEEALLVPAGFGSLRQEQITLTLQSGNVQLKVTPLEEWVVRLTAPDTYQRLSSLAELHRSESGNRNRISEGDLFLVSFYTDAQGESFRPEDVFLENRSRRHQPADIRPVTGGWGTQRLQQRDAQQAVYFYAGAIDLALDLTVEYGGVRNTDWSFILQRLEAERSRARARAGLRGAP